MNDFICISAAAAAAFHAAVALKFQLQMLQQNSYRLSRYGRWLKGGLWSGAWCFGAVLALLSFLLVGRVWFCVAAGVLAVGCAVMELRRKYKKPLVFTARARRIYAVAAVLSAAAIAAAGAAGGVRWCLPAALAAAVCAPLSVAAAVVLLSPVERAINRWYYNDARRILESMPDLKIIGITGSYGKTSTKHYLYRILSEKYNVLMTPGSYNTTLGVIRTVREQLRPYHEVFLVEMGAKQRGDIREICELVHPTIGIVTSVGEQHLESFGSIENVQATKFELVDALPADGMAVLNDDFEYVASRRVENVRRVFRYTHGERGRDFSFEVKSYSAAETLFEVKGPQDEVQPLATSIVGSYNLSNIVAGYIVARELGVDAAAIRYAVGNIEQVEHRLNMKRTAGGVTVIDDAFNSNPHGAQMALEVLSGMKGGRRVVVTPGMIELGRRQEHHNRELGRRMASSCDWAIVVGEYNRAAIVEGLREGGFDEGRIYLAPTFADATARLATLLAAGDAVLYENDLPDTFK